MIANPYINKRRCRGVGSSDNTDPPQRREHPLRRVLLRNMLAACCDGASTISSRHLIESCLRIANPYIKQRRIANPPLRGEHPSRRGEHSSRRVVVLVLRQMAVSGIIPVFFLPFEKVRLDHNHFGFCLSGFK